MSQSVKPNLAGLVFCCYRCMIRSRVTLEGGHIYFYPHFITLTTTFSSITILAKSLLTTPSVVLIHSFHLPSLKIALLKTKPLVGSSLVQSDVNSP